MNSASTCGFTTNMLIKNKNDENFDKDGEKIKLSRNPKSE